MDFIKLEVFDENVDSGMIFFDVDFVGDLNFMDVVVADGLTFDVQYF